MGKRLFAPTHTNSFEALLNQPFARTLNQSTANGQAHGFQLVIVHVIAVFCLCSNHFDEAIQPCLG